MASKIDNDDLFVCPICFEQVSSPKYLPCLHTFCYQCLKSYILTQLGGEGKKSEPFPCPVCRQPVQISDPSLFSESIADTLPGNHLITSLIERSSASNEDKGERICDPCNLENRKLAASTWCIVCLEAMCETCSACHKRLKSSRSHKTLPVGEISEGQGTALLDIDELCTKHAGKVLEVYCSDHKQMCCVLCLATQHRECRYISTLDEMVSGSDNLESVEEFISYLNSVDKKTEEVKVKMESNIRTLGSRRDEISDEVCGVIKKVQDRLDILKAGFLTNLQQKHKEQNLKLSERQEQIEIFQSNIKKGNKLLQAVRKQGSPKQLFVTKEKIKMQLQNHMVTLKKDLEDANCVDYGLNLDDTLISVAESLKSVTEFEVMTTGDLSDSVREVIEMIGKLGNEEPEHVDIKKLKVTELCKIGSEHFGGGTFLPDGRLVVCSTDSKKIQAYTTRGIMLFEKEICNCPRDACLVSPNEVVVSLCDTNFLIKYEATQVTFIEKNAIRCKSRPGGLMATKDNILVGYNYAVDVLSLDGTLIRTLSILSQRGSFAYVAMSSSCNVYFSDGDDVISETLDGREVSRFYSPYLKRLFGIAVDKYDNVYACGLDSSNVYVFSPDGKNNRALVENINCPNGIGFNIQGTRLFIATANGVYVYSFELI